MINKYFLELMNAYKKLLKSILLYDFEEEEEEYIDYHKGRSAEQYE